MRLLANHAFAQCELRGLVNPWQFQYFRSSSPVGRWSSFSTVTDAAGTVRAHGLAVGVAMGMAAVALRVLTDEAYAQQVRADFKLNKALR